MWKIGNLNGDDGRTIRDETNMWVCQTAIPKQATEIVRDREQAERLRGALEKIAKRYPCETADAMSRLAGEAIGVQ